MARPEEKANAMLNKFLKMRDAGNAPRVDRKKRPVLASECDNLNDAERFRRQLLREISNLISKIQNPGLGEHAIRDTNDEINRKMREKHHWNKRILQLGGPDFAQMELKQQLENMGGTDTSLLGSGGYRYYGAAKDLPGVKELFQQQALKQQKKRNRADLYRRITPDYYGWRDEEDGALLEMETQATQRYKARFGLQDEPPIEQILQHETMYVPPPPSQVQIEQALLERKKQDLLSRLTT